jgi:restriction endonuclease S subunit
MIVTIGATLGKVGLLAEAASSNQQITAVVFSSDLVLPEFGAYQLKRLEPVLRAIAPSTTLPIMDQNEVGMLPLAAPSLSEQSAICAYLGHQTGTIDALMAKVEEAIERLQEYRTALISAAVTGKIDVRDTLAEEVDRA